MSLHIEAKPDDVAPVILLPGDPLRAEFVAERYLTHAVCYNRVRGMLGFTGSWNGTRVSVQGTGMGQPSLSIYVTELIREYGARRLIRIGSCGSLQPEVRIRDIVVAMSASTDSAMNADRFPNATFAPTAHPGLFLTTMNLAAQRGIKARAGSVLATDTFYHDDAERWRTWAAYGLVAVEMETAALYTLAAKHHAEAVTILTVSDSLVTGESTTPDERRSSFTDMMELALAVAAAD